MDLKYAVPAGAPGASARIEIFAVNGRKIRTLARDLPRGSSGSLRWDGRDDSGRAAPSGIYLVRAEVGDQSAVQRLVFIR